MQFFTKKPQVLSFVLRKNINLYGRKDHSLKVSILEQHNLDKGKIYETVIMVNYVKWINK